MLKPNEIVVLSRKQASEFVTDRPYIWISISDTGKMKAEMPNNPNEICALFLEFDDIDGSKFPNFKENDKVKIFSTDDAKSILSVISLSQDYVNLIVINCEAGHNRSPAVAAALKRLMGKSDEDYIFSQGKYHPNSWVYKTILNEGIKL